MSFAIPGIAIADVPNYVKKFYVLNFAKTTGIVAGTPFEVFNLTNVEIATILVQQDNTTPQANNIDYILTIDGETIRGDNIAHANATLGWLYMANMGMAPAIGENPFIWADFTHALGFGLFQKDDTGVVRTIKHLSGHSVKLEVNLDTIGAAQEFHADVWYQKKEAA